MKPSFFIKTHFLGSKIKHLRKSNKMTLEDLSIRCYQIDSSSAPSVSYLSLIESGQRSPSEKLLKSICFVFQKQKLFHEAEANYKKALLINPNFTEAYNNLGNTFKELGKIDESIKCYKKAIKLYVQ